MILVANRHGYQQKYGQKSFYIGRGSPVGNPFVVGKDGTREDVIAKFHHELRRAYAGLPNAIDTYSGIKGGARDWLKHAVEWLPTGYDVVLVCSCAPKACHGDVLKLAIERIATL